jgi:integrase
MLKALRDMGIEGITVHGFRSSFADWAAEQTSVAKEGPKRSRGGVPAHRFLR